MPHAIRHLRELFSHAPTHEGMHPPTRKELRRRRLTVRRTRRTSTIAMGVVGGLVAATVGSGIAVAAAEDRAEAEGYILNGSGIVDVDSIAQLQGAYTAYPPGDEIIAPLDVTVLDTLNLQVGASVLPLNQILDLGAVGQYSSSDIDGAFASSGLIGADGAIAAGSGDPAENTYLTLAPVLDLVGVEDLVSDLSLELGAVSAQAQAERTAGGSTLTSDYQIANGILTLDAPAIGDAVTTIDTALADTSTAVNGTVDTIDSTVGSLLDGIDAILEGLLGGLVDLDDPTVTTDLNLDLGTAIDSVTAAPFVSGPVTITLSTGEVVIDLDELYALNSAAPNTELIGDLAVNATLAAAISDVLTTQLPNALDAAIDEVLNTTNITIDVDAGVLLGIPPLQTNVGDLAIQIDGTLGGLLGNPGQPTPTVSLDGTNILGLDIGDLLTPVTDYVVATILPAVGTIVDDALGTATLETFISDTLTGLVTSLSSVLDALSEVVSVTINVQESPGDFPDPDGLNAGSFTQRAVTVSVAPALASGLAVLNLASATVRAVAFLPPANLTIDPDRGPFDEATPVTIDGDDLASTTDIVFGAVPVDSFTVNPDGSISTAAPPQSAPGTVTVGVTNDEGTNTDLEFEYYNVTSVDEITPESGPTAGGTDVTIIGECLTGATEVLFDGVAGTDLDVVSDTELTVTTPAGTAGSVDVTIVNPTDCGDITVDDGFTYVAPGAPTLTDIDPDRGPETGGTTVIITGTDFTDAEAVTFDGIDATSFTVDSDTQITATTPAYEPGIADVIVTNAAGDSAPLDFEFYDVTDVDEVDPDSGPEAGGNEVTITGSCFEGATDVRFDGVSAPSFTVVDDTTITAVVPAGVPGTSDVTVVGAGECGDGTLDDGYEYIAEPVVTDLTPTEGPETGGTVVTIEGSGFTGTTGVDFGGEAGTDLDVVDDTTIEVTTPVHDPGVVDVTVLHPGGDVDAGDFEFLNVPSVTSIDPTSGPEDGGTVVTVTGEGFTDATAVTFDGDPGTDFTVDSDTQITVTTPAHVPAVVPVVVEHPVQDADAGDFEYVAGTEVDDVDPGSGPEDGGNEVTITGVCFTGATDVLFGGVSATSFTVADDATITAVVPAGTPGTVDVTVVGSAECGTGVLDDGYEYLAEPVITDLTPTEGPETGGTVVTITGDGLEETTGVDFGDVAGTDLEIVDDTEIRITTPVHDPGVVDVTVLHPGGDVVAGPFEFLNVPSITSIDPTQGPEDGGTVVTVTGEGFTDATGVTFDGTSGTDFSVDSDTQITVTTPAHDPAVVDVVVEHPVENSAAGEFEFVAGTEIDDVTPPGGPEAGGTEVTITGACFTGATEVLFGSTPATSFTVVSDTEIVAIAPAGVGVVDVTVVGSAECGTDTVPDGYEYTDDPVIGTIDPTTGPETGGTVVTITGANLGDAESVTFDGAEGTELDVVSDTELTVTTPAGDVGAADVVVTSPAGSSDPGVFTYYAVTAVDDTDPGSGPVTGGTDVTITGQCFTGATAVLFGTVASPEFQVVSDSVIRATAPAGTAIGTVDVSVVGAGDCGTGVLEDGFTYTAVAAGGGGILSNTGGAAPSEGLWLLGGILVALGALMAVMRRRRA